VTDQTGHSKSLNEMVGAHRARITEMKEVSRLSEDEFETLRVVHPLTHNTESLAQFNALVQKLMLHGDGNNFAVAVTGLSRGVGVSYVALNIAAALAADYRRTALLIQCNPYPSVLNRMMEPYPDCGLMDYLDDPEMDIDDIVYSPGVARMRVMPYGDERIHSRLLAHDRMHDMLRAARSRYSDRFIVLDLPDVLDLGHARSVLGWVDATVLVVPYGVSDRRAVRLGIDAVGQNRLAGLVMNRVPG